MDTQTYARLFWQIPVIVFISVLFIPDIPWYSSAIGAWPIWLLSLPFVVFVRHIVSNNVPREANHSMKSAQVFVFQNTGARYHCIGESQKRAA